MFLAMLIERAAERVLRSRTWTRSRRQRMRAILLDGRVDGEEFLVLVEIVNEMADVEEDLKIGFGLCDVVRINLRQMMQLTRLPFWEVPNKHGQEDIDEFEARLKCEALTRDELARAA